MNSREEFEKWYKEEGLDLCENVEKYFVEKAWQHQQEKIDELKAENFALSAMGCKHPDKRIIDENYDTIKDYCDMLKAGIPMSLVRFVKGLYRN